MSHRVAIAGLALGLAVVVAAPQAFAAPQLVLDLQIDYFAGSVQGPPIFPESSLGGAVQFYEAGRSPFTEFDPFLQLGPPIDVGRLAVGQTFSTRFIAGPPIDVSRLGFSFGGHAAGFPAQAFAPGADPILTVLAQGPPIDVLANGPPIDVLLNGPPIRSSGAIFAFDDPVQVGTWSASVSAVDVPEPATWAMLLLGFCGAGAALRRARRAVAA